MLKLSYLIIASYFVTDTVSYMFLFDNDILLLLQIQLAIYFCFALYTLPKTTSMTPSLHNLQQKRKAKSKIIIIMGYKTQ